MLTKKKILGVNRLNKVRIYELAKELGTSSKDLITVVQGLKIDVHNHMSSLEDEDVKTIKGHFEKQKKKDEEKKPEKAPEKAPDRVPERTPERTAERRPEQRHEGRPEGQTFNRQDNRPDNRPAGQNRPDNRYDNRPQGSRPDYRPDNRPTDNRPADNRPAGQNRPDNRYDNRPQGSRPDYRPDNRPTDNRPADNRPAGQNRPDNRYDNRPQGSRPDYRPDNRPTDNRPADNRPAGQNRPDNRYDNRPQGNRPDYRPDNRPADNRPADNRPADNRPAGQNRPDNRYDNRPQGNRPDYRPDNRPANRPPAPRPQSSRPNNATSPKPENQNEEIIKKSEALEKIEAANIITTTKKDFSKVEKIGKKPQGRPGGRPQGRPGGRPFGRRDMADVKRDEPQVSKKPIKIGESTSVKELGEKLGKTATDIIKKLLMIGVMATINQELDFDTAALICGEFGATVEKQIDKESEEVLLKFDEDKTEDLKLRPPVVTIMGHVDHGKTSLLDAIRETNVIATEAGGITQHIGAYTVTIDGKKIAFLDTPGHEAFTAMRARGAKVTDIAILVVAADDGVMPQTVEAINHAKAANVAIIVAVNKIDKPGANPDKVKQELTEYGLVSEEWGGDTIFVPVSAKQKINIDNLLEMILLVAEMQELKANPNRKAIGTVIEAELDKGKGPVATVLIQTGTLNIGDTFVVGNTFGKVRAMIDDKGKRVKKAGPSTPVEIQGLSEVPDAGDIFNVVDDERIAKLIAEKRRDKQWLTQQQSKQKVSLDELFNQIQEGKVKDLNVIVKADVQGSVEAVKQSLAKLSNNEVKVKTIHGGVGAITETDVMFASASNAIIIGFNVRPQPAAMALAERDKVDVRLYRVIYNAIEDIEAAMKGMLEPEYKEVIQGHVEVRATFKVSSIGTIAGGYVTDGKITRSSDIRVIRNGIVVHEGKLASLKRFKDDAKEVNTGYECGLNIERFNDIKEGDIIESYTIETVPRK